MVDAINTLKNAPILKKTRDGMLFFLAKISNSMENLGRLIPVRRNMVGIKVENNGREMNAQSINSVDFFNSAEQAWALRNTVLNKMNAEYIEGMFRAEPECKTLNQYTPDELCHKIQQNELSSADVGVLYKRLLNGIFSKNKISLSERNEIINNYKDNARIRDIVNSRLCTGDYRGGNSEKRVQIFESVLSVFKVYKDICEQNSGNDNCFNIQVLMRVASINAFDISDDNFKKDPTNEVNNCGWAFLCLLDSYSSDIAFC